MTEENKQVTEKTEKNRPTENAVRAEEPPMAQQQPVGETQHEASPAPQTKKRSAIDDAIYRQKERLYKKQHIPVRVLDVIIGVCLVAIVVVIVVGLINRG